MGGGGLGGGTLDSHETTKFHSPKWWDFDGGF